MACRVEFPACHVIFEQWCLLWHSIAFCFSIASKQRLCFTGLQACHSWIHHVIFASVEASFPIVGAWWGLLMDSISTTLFAAGKFLIGCHH
jgi:hypothetical protein